MHGRSTYKIDNGQKSVAPLPMGNASSSSQPRNKRRSTVHPRMGRHRMSNLSVSSEKTCVPEPKRESQVPSNSGTAYTGIDHISADAVGAYKQFLHDFPGTPSLRILSFSGLMTVAEYKLTWILDTLRRTDYGRLIDSGETYVDYMGGSIYPESLVRVHMDFLSRNVFGNTHSVSNRSVLPGLYNWQSLTTRHSSLLSASCANEARAAVLSFSRAPAEEYSVIFTPNASGALKLVGESYPFTCESRYVLSCDSHNSVHGIREFAARRGAGVCYIPSTSTGGFEVTVAHVRLLIPRFFHPSLT
jgi:hypothetical protein